MCVCGVCMFFLVIIIVVRIQYRLSLIWSPLGQCSLAGIASEVAVFQKITAA